MVAIAIGTIAVNAMNDYTGSLSLQAAGLRIKRIYSAAVVGVLGFLFTLFLQYTATSPRTSRTSSCSSATGSRRSSASSWRTGGSAAGRPTAARSSTSPAADGDRRPRRARRRVRWSGSRSRTRRSATRWGGPFNYVTANYLHGADLAYYVGGVVAFLIYWWGRSAATRPPLRRARRRRTRPGRSGRDDGTAGIGLRSLVAGSAGPVAADRWTTGSSRSVAT